MAQFCHVIMNSQGLRPSCPKPCWCAVLPYRKSSFGEMKEQVYFTAHLFWKPGLALPLLPPVPISFVPLQSRNLALSPSWFYPDCFVSSYWFHFFFFLTSLSIQRRSIAACILESIYNIQPIYRHADRHCRKQPVPLTSITAERLE